MPMVGNLHPYSPQACNRKDRNQTKRHQTTWNMQRMLPLQDKRFDEAMKLLQLLCHSQNHSCLLQTTMELA